MKWTTHWGLAIIWRRRNDGLASDDHLALDGIATACNNVTDANQRTEICLDRLIECSALHRIEHVGERTQREVDWNRRLFGGPDPVLKHLRKVFAIIR